MFINSGIFEKFMRVECAVCGEDETMEFSCIRQNLYDEKDDDLIEISYRSNNHINIFDRMKMVHRHNTFYKKSDVNEPFMELLLNFYQIEDMMDFLYDVLTDYDFSDFEKKFDVHSHRLESKQFIKYEVFKDEYTMLLFKSKDGLQLTLDENAAFYAQPIHLGFSTADNAIMYPKDRIKTFLRYIVDKYYTHPFDEVYFYLGKNEAIEFLATLSFILEKKEKGELIL